MYGMQNDEGIAQLIDTGMVASWCSLLSWKELVVSSSGGWGRGLAQMTLAAKLDAWTCCRGHYTRSCHQTLDTCDVSQ